MMYAEQEGSTPSLPAVKYAVTALRSRSTELTQELETLAVRLRLMTQQLDIVVECMDIMLGDHPPCPTATFPELNIHDEE